MKMIFIAYSESIEEEVMEILSGGEIEGYSKWTQVLGSGRSSGPHLATAVWPKANNMLMICTEEKQARQVMDGVRSLRLTMGHEGVKAFSWEIEEVT